MVCLGQRTKHCIVSHFGKHHVIVEIPQRQIFEIFPYKPQALATPRFDQRIEQQPFSYVAQWRSADLCGGLKRPYIVISPSSSYAQSPLPKFARDEFKVMPCFGNNRRQFSTSSSCSANWTMSEILDDVAFCAQYAWSTRTSSMLTHDGSVASFNPRMSVLVCSESSMRRVSGSVF